mgnify:CR=1 FL=1
MCHVEWAGLLELYLSPNVYNTILNMLVCKTAEGSRVPLKNENSRSVKCPSLMNFLSRIIIIMNVLKIRHFF